MGKVKGKIKVGFLEYQKVSIPYGKGKEQHFVLQIYYIP